MSSASIYFAFHGTGYIMESSLVRKGLDIDITKVERTIDNIKDEIRNEFVNLYAYLYLEDIDNVYQIIRRLSNAVSNSMSENHPVRVDNRVSPFQIAPMEL